MPAHPPPAAYCQVALDVPLRTLFDYRCPTEGALKPGSRVQVPFGRGQRTGIVISLNDQSSLPQNKIKTVTKLLDAKPLINAELLGLLQWSADYYHHPLGEVIAAALPGPLRKGDDSQRHTESVWRLSDAGKTTDEQTLSRAPQQLAIVRLLQTSAPHKELDSTELSTHLPAWQQPMQALIKKGLIEQQTRDTRAKSRTLMADKKNGGPGSEPLFLNQGQQEALNSLSQHLEQFSVSLLYGVTGSGKTEVYLQLAAKVLKLGKQVLVLVPEIGLTSQTLDRFQQRFPNASVAVLHSGLSERQRTEYWLQAYEGDAQIIIGTRSAVLCPLIRPGLIIIDEEHDSSFKQQEGFRYNARDLAIKRAKGLGIPVMLGSATPSLESWRNAAQGQYQLLQLPERAGAAELPEVRLLDARHTKMSGLICNQLLQLIQQHLENQGQVLLFLNRRGFSPILLCHGCGSAPGCSRCEHHFTLHLGRKKLVCHHCGSERPVPKQCPACKSQELIAIGAGTERIEAGVRDQFPQYQVLRIDRDTTRRKGELQQSLDAAFTGGAQILLGTQMLAKGHHFPKVSLVAVLDGDQGLFSTDFRATERLTQTLFQVSGRSGRGDQRGEVVIQTHSPEHPLWSKLLNSKYDQLANMLLDERSSAQMPPYTHFALLRAESVQQGAAHQFLASSKQQAQQLGSGEVQLLGPIAAPMEKRAGRYRFQLLLQSGDRNRLQHLLRHWVPLLDQLESGKKVRWSLDVDPIEMY